MSLLFSTFRAANQARLPTFRSRSGALAHTSPGEGLPIGFDWDRRTWCMALLGEVGELANEVKKVRRGDATIEERKKAIGDEITDVLTYLDLVAWRFGTSIEHALLLQFGLPGVTEGNLSFEHLPVHRQGVLRETPVSDVVLLGVLVGSLCRAADEADRGTPLAAPVRLTIVNASIAEMADLLFRLLRRLDLDPVSVVLSKWNAVSVRVNSPVRLWMKDGVKEEAPAPSEPEPQGPVDTPAEGPGATPLSLSEEEVKIVLARRAQEARYKARRAAEAEAERCRDPKIDPKVGDTITVDGRRARVSRIVSDRTVRIQWLRPGSGCYGSTDWALGAWQKRAHMPDANVKKASEESP